MKYDELRKLAEEASDGPWGVDPPSKERATLAHIIRERQTGPQVGNVLLEEDAAYIAAASPDVILALLDERERLREVVRKLLEPAPVAAFDSGLDPNAELAAFMDIRHAAYKEARALLQGPVEATSAHPEGVES